MKFLDTKYKERTRMEIVLMILDACNGQPIDKLHLFAIYDLVILALDYDWIHPNY